VEPILRIFGVDPGTKKSGWCYINLECDIEIKFGHDWNRIVIEELRQFNSLRSELVLGYEWLQNYGGVVGEDVFRTCYMCGRLREAHVGDKFHEPTRPTIIKHFTGRTNLKKNEVRKVLLSRFGGE